MTNQLTVAVDDPDAAEANILAGELQAALRQDVPDVQVTRMKADTRTQDFGATLVLILGTTAVTKLADGIAAWLASRHQAKLRLTRTTSDGRTEEVVVEGQLGHRTREIVSHFLEDAKSDV
jgi:hypothetical protein